MTFEDMPEEYHAPDKTVKYGWLARLVHNDETDKVDIATVAIEFEKFNHQSIFENLFSFTFH